MGKFYDFGYRDFFIFILAIAVQLIADGVFALLEEAMPNLVP